MRGSYDTVFTTYFKSIKAVRHVDLICACCAPDGSVTVILVLILEEKGWWLQAEVYIILALRDQPTTDRAESFKPFWPNLDAQDFSNINTLHRTCINGKSMTSTSSSHSLLVLERCLVQSNSLLVS